MVRPGPAGWSYKSQYPTVFFLTPEIFVVQWTWRFVQMIALSGTHYGVRILI